MARGKAANIGDTRIAPNNYHYTKVEDDGSGKPGWRLTHHIIAEQKLGRKLREDERVTFIGSRRDLSPANIKVVEKGRGSLRRRLAQIEARIQELQAEKEEIEQELLGPTKTNRNR